RGRARTAARPAALLSVSVAVRDVVVTATAGRRGDREVRSEPSPGGEGSSPQAFVPAERRRLRATRTAVVPPATSSAAPPSRRTSSDPVSARPPDETSSLPPCAEPEPEPLPAPSDAGTATTCWLDRTVPSASVATREQVPGSDSVTANDAKPFAVFLVSALVPAMEMAPSGTSGDVMVSVIVGLPAGPPTVTVNVWPTEGVVVETPTSYSSAS